MKGVEKEFSTRSFYAKTQETEQENFVIVFAVGRLA
jgi:hypothetical protein